MTDPTAQENNSPSVRRTALVTGITGQDGYYLTKLLCEKGCHVHGIVRRASTMNRVRIDRLRSEMDLEGRLTLHYGDLLDGSNIMQKVLELEPDEIYNLAAQSHVRVSFDEPVYTHAVNAQGALHVLEAAKVLNRRKEVRVYQASTSEMFGGLPGTAPQSESTPLHPRSPYAVSKVAAFHHTMNYRESYDLFACNGILFNHESPVRGESFVTRKITIGAARIKMGLQSSLSLGNLAARRDWGYAQDYVETMWRMLQQNTPDDYVVATGAAHRVEDFVQQAFDYVELDWHDHVRIDPRFLRPAEVEVLCGDASKARERLGWEPSTSFADLVRIMMDHDLAEARKEQAAAVDPERREP